MTEKVTITEEDKKKKRKKWLWLLLLLLCLAIGGGTWYYFAHKNDGLVVTAGLVPDSKDAKDITEKELKKLAQTKADSSQYTVNVLSEITVNENGEGNLGIKNLPVNVYPINVKYYTKSDNKLIYESGIIYPGKEVTTAKLTKALPKGTYPVSAMFDIYDQSGKTIQGSTEANVNLTVE